MDRLKKGRWQLPLFDQLSGAFQNIKRADMVEFVRCEQLHLLNEKLKRAKETVQLCKTRSNEQMRLVKAELRETKDELQQNKEELRKSNEQTKVAKEELRQTKEELRKSKALSGARNKTPKVASMPPALPVTDRIKALKVAAQPGESAKDRTLRALHIMSMLRGYGQPELWGHVSQHFVKERLLDLTSVLSSTNLPDLVYLLQSGAASDVTKLNLSYNAAFAGEEAGRALGAALAEMSTLYELNLAECSLTDRSWAHIADGISQGCQQLKILNLSYNAAFAGEEAGRSLAWEPPWLRCRHCVYYIWFLCGRVAGANHCSCRRSAMGERVCPSMCPAR